MALSAPRAEAERARQGRVDALPGVVAAPGDGAGGPRQAPHEVVSRADAQGGGHGVLLLEQEPIAGPLGAPVELDPGRQQRLVGDDERRVVALPQQAAGRLRPAQRVHVAQAAPAFLEVGFEEEGHLAGLLVTGPHPAGQVGQPALGPLLPLLDGLAGQLLGEALVAGEVAHLQERGGGVEVVGGQRQGFAHGPNGVAELQALVPDRVPEGVGEGADVGAAPVQEQDVDVGVEAELGPAVAADGDERHVLEAHARTTSARSSTSQESTRSL